ncbi:SCO3374 family protein [Streptomyces sp. NPDC004609]|uniref:SCO3374 family protein n=1 Tax=Streptomyces sp. NPDC004609 TaxID=3364704 RepID=UPI0036C67DDC
MTVSLPSQRQPSEGHEARSRAVARWYGTTLGWAVAEGSPAAVGGPVRLLTGLRFDVLELPADAGAAVLRRAVPTGPVALEGDRMRLLVAAGSADELPELLDWLQWGGIALGLTALGAGGRTTAPVPPGWAGSRGAAVWLRPPVPGREVEPTLPALAPFGRRGPGAGAGGGPDLVRLLDTAATECHRARLLRTNVRANQYQYAAGEYSAD